MGIYLNAGYEKFARTVRSKMYIDKTGLLQYTNSVLDTEDGCGSNEGETEWHSEWHSGKNH